MGFEPCLSALERPTRAVRSETIAVRSFTSSVKSVMGITSHQMEGSARHEAADSKDDSIRAADSRPILPSHRACAKKRAAKQRPSSESARYLDVTFISNYLI